MSEADRSPAASTRRVPIAQGNDTVTDHDGPLLVVQPWRIGHVVDRYTLRRELGAGAMGVVFAAHDSQLHREVALKLLRPDASRDPERLALRLLREARAVARIRHPNVVTIHDAGRAGRDLFIAMELLRGQTLRQWLVAEPRTTADRLGVLRPAAQGLAAAHEAGLVHRDFKPANVFVEPGGRVCVLDFGLARSLEEIDPEDEPTTDGTDLDGHAIDRLATLTRTGALVGTPAYMSPEQLRRQPLDARSDQFAFCVAAYEALCGHRPFAGTTAAAVLVNMLDARFVAPPPDVGVPPAVLAVLRRGLHEHPAERFASMTALCEALDDATRRPATSPAVWVGLGALAVAGTATMAIAWPTNPSSEGKVNGAADAAAADAGQTPPHDGADGTPNDGGDSALHDGSGASPSDGGDSALHDGSVASSNDGQGAASRINPDPAAAKPVTKRRAKMILFRGSDYLSFDLALDRTDPGYPRPLADGRFENIWPQGPHAAFERDGRVFLVRNTEILEYRFDGDEPVLQPTAPTRLGEGRWAGVDAPSIDAAFVLHDHTYLFHDDRYWRLDGAAMDLAPGYPRAVDETTWPGLWPGQLDSAVRSNRGGYLFQGGQYTRYNLQLVEPDPGYPKTINEGLWPGMGGQWPNDIDAAFHIRLEVGAPISVRARP